MIRRIERAEGSRFQVYAQRDGKKVYVGTFDSKREAVAAEEDYKSQQRAIDRGELPPDIDDKRTLREAMHEWLAALAQRGSRSLDQYRIRANVYILPTLGDVPLVRLTRSHVMRWRDEMATRFAPATVNGTLVCLQSSCSEFVDRGWIAASPARGVPQIESPDRDYHWIRTREEITKLLVECPRGIREIATVALGTGMRLDELLHVHWSDLDFTHRLITVQRGKHGTTKTSKLRRVPIVDSILPLLRELALQRDGAVLVFPGKAGKPRTKVGVRVPFKQAAARAQLSDKLRFHDLRHTFASHWVANGGDIFRLSKVLGHSSVVQTEKTYAHLSPDAFEQDFDRVSFVVPASGAPYGLTKRKPTKPSVATAERPALRAVK